VEGVSNILLLGFQTTITKKDQEITNNADFSLPIPKRERSNPSFTKKIHHKHQEKKHPRGVHKSSSSIHQKIHHKTFAQEKNTIMPKNSENFSQVLLQMGELCYKMRFT
jgi:hypothetical protein